MITARVGTIVLPQGTRCLGHLKIIAANLLRNLSVTSFALENDEPKQIADKGIRRPNLFIKPLFLPFRTKLFRESLP